MKKATVLLCLVFSVLRLSANVLYVSLSANGSNDGTSWEDAYNNLQDALSEAVSGDTVWVAQGVYFPVQGTDRNARFELADGVVMLGGFSGSEASASERDWELNETVLSGDIGNLGDSTDNSHTVLYLHFSGPGTVVDGFVLKHGNADGSEGPTRDPSKCGGALYIEGENGEAYPQIMNCRFEYNFAINHGGAVYANGFNGSIAPAFVDCIFQNNRAGKDGGAVRRVGGSWTGTADDFRGCIFRYNESGEKGGGVMFIDSERLDTVEFNDCAFEGNVAGTLGGGLCLLNGRFDSPSGFVIKGCSFMENRAPNGGGAYVNPRLFEGIDFMSIEDCDFISNEGEGVSATSSLYVLAFPYAVGEGVAVIRNCSFHSNVGNGTILVEAEFKELFLEGSKFENNVSTQNIVHFPFPQKVFVEGCFVSDNSFTNSLFDFAGVPSVSCSNSIFKGNTEHYGLAFRSGISSSVIDTIVNCVIDITSIDDNSVNPYSGTTHIYNSIIFEEGENSSLSSIGGDSIHLESSLVTMPDCASLPAHVTCGSGMLFGLDPMLMDTSGGDYRPSPCSPVRNVGSNGIVSQLGLQLDLEGNNRIQEGTVDIGAFEEGLYTVSIDTVLNAGCHGEGSGAVSLTVGSACLPLSVSSGGATTVVDSSTVTISNLFAGNHSFTVSDAQGREEVLSVEISEPVQIEASLDLQDVDCEAGTLGGAMATASGGIPSVSGGYTYLWDGIVTGPVLEDAMAGEHILEVLDSVGCSLMDSFMIETVGQIALVGMASPLACTGDSSGAASVTPVNGLGAYEYLWDNNSTDSVITGLPAGTWGVTVTGSNGCVNSTTVDVEEPPLLVVDIQAPEYLCFGDTNGTASAIVTGGTPLYSYFWEGAGTDSVLVGLSPGFYGLIVSDLNGCEGFASVEIIGYEEIVAEFEITHASTATSSDGAISMLNIMGGSGGYTYQWDSGESFPSILDLSAGEYSLVITDSTGCEREYILEVEFGTGVGEMAKVFDGFKIVPNPSSASQPAHLIVDFPSQYSGRVCIVDGLGRVVSRTGLSEMMVLKDISLSIGLPSGTYMVGLEKKGGGWHWGRWVVLE